MVECRYSQTGAAQQSLASVGYMVKTPSSTLPSLIISNGLYGVQLRIAEGIHALFSKPHARSTVLINMAGVKLYISSSHMVICQFQCV